jgi:hypothetical protein
MGAQHIPNGMRACYEQLVVGGFIGRDELLLLEAWLSDLDSLAR